MSLLASSRSVLAPPPPGPSEPVPPSDALPALAREIAHLEQRLQTLLDAQSDGLLAELGHPAPSPPPHSSRPPPSASPSTSRSRSPQSAPPGNRSRASRHVLVKNEPLSLGDARRGIAAALRRLARLHASQAAAYTAQRAPLTRFRARADALVAKQGRIAAEIARLEGGNDGGGDAAPADGPRSPAAPSAASVAASAPSASPALSAEPTSAQLAGTEAEPAPLLLPHPPPLPGHQAPDAALAAAEARLAGDVATLETHLTVLRLRLEAVRARRARRASAAAARLSSWRGAAEAVAAQIKEEILEGGALAGEGAEGGRWLERQKRKKGTKEQGQGARNGRQEQDLSVSVWALSTGRRTVELVAEEVEAELARLHARQERAATEGRACGEGADVWSRMVREVGRVEARLRREMQGLGAQQGAPDPAVPTHGMRGVLELMDEVLAALAAAAEDARGKGWVLLELAVGAEHEALRQAKDLLRRALASTTPASAGPPGATELVDVAPTKAAPSKQGMAKSGALIDNAEDGGSEEHPKTLQSTANPWSVTATNGSPYAHEPDANADAPGPELLVEVGR